MQNFWDFFLYLAYLAIPAYIIYAVFGIRGIFLEIKTRTSKTWSIVAALYSILTPVIILLHFTPSTAIFCPPLALISIFALLCGKKQRWWQFLLGVYAYLGFYFLAAAFAGMIAEAILGGGMSV